MNAHARDFRPALPDALEAEQGRCSVEGCSKERFAKGWCQGHYLRWYRHGDPLAGGTSPGEAQHFFREVVLAYEGDECLIWPFGATNGYGTIKRDGKQYFVSTLVCEEVRGPRPTPDHQAAHTCGRGSSGCVTKGHLVWKTRKENEADKLIHGTHKRGERCNFAKISTEEAQQILALKGKLLQREIADLFGIGQGQVSRIHSGKRWGWLE